MAAVIKMPLGVEVGLGPGDFVLNGNSAHSSPEGDRAPKFSAHVYCGQIAGYIKIVVGMEVGLIPGDFMLDGDPAFLPKKGWSPLPSFQPISIVAKRLDSSRCHLV